MSIQQQAHQEFCSLAKESKSGSVYLLMRLSDLLYDKHNVAVYLRDPWSLFVLTDRQAQCVLDLLPELRDDRGAISQNIQDAMGL